VYSTPIARHTPRILHCSPPTIQVRKCSITWYSLSTASTSTHQCHCQHRSFPPPVTVTPCVDIQLSHRHVECHWTASSCYTAAQLNQWGSVTWLTTQLVPPTLVPLKPFSNSWLWFIVFIPICLMSGFHWMQPLEPHPRPVLPFGRQRRHSTFPYADLPFQPTPSHPATNLRSLAPHLLFHGLFLGVSEESLLPPLAMAVKSARLRVAVEAGLLLV